MARISSPAAARRVGGRGQRRDGDDPGLDTDTGYGGGVRIASGSSMPVDLVLLAAPRGFCAGVEMAIKALAWMVRAFEPPVYCYHEIVHNKLVVERFQQLGVVFVDDIAEVPEGRPIMLSAHGSAPDGGGRRPGPAAPSSVNAVCPLVTKVHHEVKRRAGKGYRIVYVGHEGHEEAVGTMAVAPDAIAPRRDGGRGRRPAADRDGQPGRPAGPDHAVAPGVGRRRRRRPDRFPDLWEPGRTDLCFATTNRQSALMAMAPRVRRHRGDRLGQLVEHPGARAAGRRGRVPAGAAGQRRRRAARRTSPGIGRA